MRFDLRSSPAPIPLPALLRLNPEDVDTIDHVLVALYAVISGPPGERDWNRFRSLFLPGAHLTSTGKAADGSIRVHPNAVEDYVTRGGAYFLKNGFFESPIHSRIETFGNIAQVFSSYESRHNAGEAPFARGINSLQLLNDGKRWWIVGILWDEERPIIRCPRISPPSPDFKFCVSKTTCLLPGRVETVVRSSLPPLFTGHRATSIVFLA